MIYDTWLIFPLILGLLTAFISSRTSLLENRAGMTVWASRRSSLPATIVSIISFPAAVAFLVAIFLVLRWYWGLGLLAICLFVFSAIVNRSNFAAFWKMRPIMDSTTVASAAVFWAGFFQTRG